MENTEMGKLETTKEEKGTANPGKLPECFKEEFEPC